MVNKIQDLQRWLLDTLPGNYILNSEKIFISNSIQQIFGFHALQLGLSQIDLLAGNRISNHYIISKDIKCDIFFLPFETNSIDLIICPHLLELNKNYQFIISECYRILTPHGRLIITCFNPKSLFGFFKHHDKFLSQLEFIKLSDLTQELSNAKFNIIGGKFLSYGPLVINQTQLNKHSWIDKIGDRWFPTFANNYALIANKELITMNIYPPEIYELKPKLATQLGTNKIWKKL